MSLHLGDGSHAIDNVFQLRKDASYVVSVECLL